MLHLRDITLVVLAGSRVAATEAAILDVFGKFGFGQTIFFSESPLSYYILAEEVLTPFRTVADATRVAWRDTLPRLRTSHALFMHWDGYPVRPEAWTDEFRNYDFIGAVWPWFTERNVGNTGFSLQSRKFLEAIQHIPIEQPEDIVLCRRQRPRLEKEFGVRFAPEAVADRFSVEHGAANAQTFGFHGVWNLLYLLDDEAMRQRLSLMTPDQWAAPNMDMLLVRALIAGRRDLYRWIDRMRNAALGKVTA